MTDLLIAGHFNCVLSQSDTTGQKNYSRGLDNLIRSYNPTDVWDISTARNTFTHYTPKGASRIDMHTCQPKPNNTETGC